MEYGNDFCIEDNALVHPNGEYAKVNFGGAPCYIIQGEFPPGRPVLQLVSENGEINIIVTVLISEELLPREVAVKAWGEHRDTFEALVKAGVVSDTGKTFEVGHVVVRIGSLLLGQRCSG